MELEEIKLFIDTDNEREKAVQLQELEKSIRAQDCLFPGFDYRVSSCMIINVRKD